MVYSVCMCASVGAGVAERPLAPASITTWVDSGPRPIRQVTVWGETNVVPAGRQELQVTDWQARTSDNDELALSPAMGGPLPLVLAGFLVLVVVGGTIDLALDRPQTLLSWHVAF